MTEYKKLQIVQDIEKCIEHFHKIEEPIISGDHFSGVSFVFFKGDIDDCHVVCDFIERNILE